MEPAFRQVRPEEAGAYRALVQAAYRQATELGVNFVAASASLEHFEAHLSRNVAYAFEQDGQLVASASIRFPWGPNPGPFGLPHLGWIATSPDHARQGWSQRMLAAVEGVLRDQLHCPAVSLGTAQDHPWLDSFYRRLGWRPAGEADLGLGHITSYFLKPLSTEAFGAWLARHPHMKEYA